jgi:hypothetical protein
LTFACPAPPAGTARPTFRGAPSCWPSASASRPDRPARPARGRRGLPCAGLPPARESGGAAHAPGRPVTMTVVQTLWPFELTNVMKLYVKFQDLRLRVPCAAWGRHRQTLRRTPHRRWAPGSAL